DDILASVSVEGPHIHVPDVNGPGMHPPVSEFPSFVGRQDHDRPGGATQFYAVGAAARVETGTVGGDHGKGAAVSGAGGYFRSDPTGEILSQQCSFGSQKAQIRSELAVGCQLAHSD